MGDCASRPKPEDLTAHLNEKFEKHDDQFYRKPDLTFAQDVDLIEEIKTQDELEHAESLFSEIQSYRKWIYEYERFLTTRLNDPSWKSVRRLIVEVQKGQDLHYPHTCLNEVSMYVRLRMEPGMPQGKDIKTSLSRNDIPKWGRCFGLQLSKDYTTLVAKVIVHRKRFSEVEYGSAAVKLRSLANQQMVSNWFPVNTPYKEDNKPALYLRVQYITEERVLVEECRSYCLEGKSSADRYMAKLKEKIQRAKDRIAPEGRG